ncbi:DUF2391 domain-containing protein [Halobaculum rarum]|uniref:DUF2391 domain-containing protein n=1 Tax=Halobaculum rarum TaxID=3075122 RepID=UPI0032B00A1A
MSAKSPDGADRGRGNVDVADVIDQLDRLYETVDTPQESREVEHTRELVRQLSVGVFGERVSKYTTRDVAEAFVGSLVFLIPLLVEDGVYEIAEHLLTPGPFGVPVMLAGNIALTLILTGALIYWSDIQRVDVTTYVAGVPVPRRLVATLVVAFATSAVMMTLWGRVDGWADPTAALGRITVVWSAAAVGAALGDLLPGESTGEDITRAVEQEIAERLGFGE